MEDAGLHIFGHFKKIRLCAAQAEPLPPPLQGALRPDAGRGAPVQRRGGRAREREPRRAAHGRLAARVLRACLLERAPDLLACPGRELREIDVGRDRRNHLNPDGLDPLRDWFDQYSRFWDDRLQALKLQVEEEHSS